MRVSQRWLAQQLPLCVSERAIFITPAFAAPSLVDKVSVIVNENELSYTVSAPGAMPDGERLQNAGLQAIAKMRAEFVQPLCRLKKKVKYVGEADETALDPAALFKDCFELDWLENRPPERLDRAPGTSRGMAQLKLQSVEILEEEQVPKKPQGQPGQARGV